MKRIVMILAVAAQNAFAQTAVVKDHFEIEIDPIAYAMNGYSLHGIYNVDHLRFDIGAYGIEYGGEMRGGKGFSTMTRGIGVKANYLLRSVKGMYAGFDCGIAANNVTERESRQSDMGHNISVGMHAGYRLFPFAKQRGPLSAIYITPWAGISYEYVTDRVKFAGYRQNNIGYFATFHFGYRL